MLSRRLVSSFLLLLPAIQAQQGHEPAQLGDAGSPVLGSRVPLLPKSAPIDFALDRRQAAGSSCGPDAGGAVCGPGLCCSADVCFRCEATIRLSPANVIGRACVAWAEPSAMLPTASSNMGRPVTRTRSRPEQTPLRSPGLALAASSTAAAASRSVPKQVPLPSRTTMGRTSTLPSFWISCRKTTCQPPFSSPRSI